MRQEISLVLLVIISIIILPLSYMLIPKSTKNEVKEKEVFWFVLHRKSNKEYLYKGVPDNSKKSKIIKIFTVKTGIPGERPTPLPKLLGKKYWLIVDKQSVKDNPETAPYFLTLNISGWEKNPYGPTPYLECHGQCNWAVPGPFGLHGVAGDESRLSPEDSGSSGCIRHSDKDITYLYNLLDPEKEAIRYYIEDI